VRVGLIVCLGSSVSFGMLACVSKVAERKRCNARALVLSLMGWSTLLTLVPSVTFHLTSQLTPKAALAALGFGVASAVGFFAFQKSVEFGNVTVAWLLMNLSAGVPAVASIWLYKERLTTLKLFSFALALLALGFLYRGQMAKEGGEHWGKEMSDW
jgi:drug/metabolite transporter (DMT)-like permease